MNHYDRAIELLQQTRQRWDRCQYEEEYSLLIKAIAIETKKLSDQYLLTIAEAERLLLLIGIDLHRGMNGAEMTEYLSLASLIWDRETVFAQHCPPN